VEVDGKEYVSGRYEAGLTRKKNIHLHAREGTAEAKFWEIRLKDLSGK
jgi:hypothetical protein